MKGFWILCMSVLFCFAEQLNYAPKIEHPAEEKMFVIVIASYNNEKYAEENLKSIFSQDYPRYRVIYTNDASLDNTKGVVFDFIEKNHCEEKFTYIENEINQGAMYNYYTMVSMCNNDEIVVIVDGDDRLFHNGVLTRLNQAYADDHVWMTYGQDTSALFPEGHSQATPISYLIDGSFRKLSYRWSHLRSYYAGLFKTIPKQMWTHQGKFFPMAQDIAQICFLMDRACEHVYFIPDILYLYNPENPINEFRKDGWRQKYFCKIIMGKPHLKKLYSKEEFL